MLIYNESSFIVQVRQLSAKDLGLENVEYTCERGKSNTNKCASIEELRNFFLIVEEKIESIKFSTY